MATTSKVDPALVQNRLTAAGFILALLVFVLGGLIALVNLETQAQWPSKDNTPTQISAPDLQGQIADTHKTYIERFPWFYLNTLVPVCLGFLLAIASIALLLHSQSVDSLSLMYLGELLLYPALAQFLASGMNNIVHGLVELPSFKWFQSLTAASPHPNALQLIIWLLRVLGLVLWLYLLVVVPAIRIYRCTDLKRRPLAVAYASTLFVVLSASALGSLLRAAPSGERSLGCAFVGQLFAPLFW